MAFSPCIPLARGETLGRDLLLLLPASRREELNLVLRNCDKYVAKTPTPFNPRCEVLKQDYLN